ncbi:sigma 54-interacting transcriptional regulator [Sinomicrobium sp. M5D2P17]
MKKRILIVEDEFIVANDLSCFLEEQNFVVSGIASTVEEALRFINKQPPYIVLLDIHLKGKLSGIDLAKRLQQLNIPFIYLSAYSNKLILEQAKKTNPYGFLVKPFREKDLRIALEIAAYHIEHNADSNTQLEKQLFEKLSSIPTDDKEEEWFEEIAKVLQPGIPFDFLFCNLVRDTYTLSLGIHRVGIKKYQIIGVNEFSNILGLSISEVERIIAERSLLKVQGIYEGTEFDRLKDLSRFEKMVSTPFKLQSCMALSTNPGHEKRLSFSFYAKRKGVFNKTRSDLIQSLDTVFSDILENKVRQKNSGATSVKGHATSHKNPELFKCIIGKSPKLLNVLHDIERVAPMKTSVLIMGESGTGKELFAKCIHQLSPRSEAPFVVINCGAIPENLIESTLFGHVKGAFTGASTNSIGKFEQANGGTIFLDEIGEMPLEMQVRLLRVLQENEIERIGDTKTIPLDVRVIAATNKNLEHEVETGNFRLDLYYRLHVFPVYAPPLRERKEDIPVLAQFFLEKYADGTGKYFTGLSEKTVDALLQYDFPGNIRELENLMERAMIVENGTTLNPGNWMPENGWIASNDDFKTFESKQKEYIIEVLDHTNWRVSGPKGAAKILGMNEKTLFAKIKRLGIEKRVGLKS